MLWHIMLIQYTASETGGAFSVALNASEQTGGSLHNLLQKEERKNISSFKARSVMQESSSITVFYPLKKLVTAIPRVPKVHEGQISIWRAIRVYRKGLGFP